MSDATALARAVVATLVECGVRHVVLCPGSRSAALAYALYDAADVGALTLHVRHDERVAGFTALGMGAATGRPAVVVTTSGTAVANLHPAVLEAHHAGVPLLVLAADRPPRLRGTWANQTSELQAEIFGAATRLTIDARPDQGSAEWVAAVRAGVGAALGGAGRPGPVHLNLGFEEPLVPAVEDAAWPRDLEFPPRMDREVGGSGPTSQARAGVGVEGGPAAGAAAAAGGEAGAAIFGPPVERAVLVAGDRAGDRARRLADWLGVPLLAEPSSGARSGPGAVGPYRLLLDNPAYGGRIQRAIVLGRPTLSRPVTRLLARPDVDVVLVQDFADEPGPERRDVRRVPAASAAAALDGPALTGSVEWLDAWRRAGVLAAQAIDEVLDSWPGVSGLLVAREVAAATGDQDALVAAASNPVRDLDLAGRPWAGAPLVHANRGLSGIDGTVSTAIGLALAGGRPTRVLVGDVAWLHDLGALVLGPSEPVPDLTVVVLNDGGGGIFSLLEQGVDAERDVGAAERFERLFGTPHGVDLAAVCAGLGVAHDLAVDVTELRAELARAPKGLRVLEIRAARADLRSLHAAVAGAVEAAVKGIAALDAVRVVS